jgi:D-lyxose ketol-isomerase
MAMSQEQYCYWQQTAKSYLDKASIVLTPEEVENIEIADVGLDEFEQIGLMVITYINTERVCAKELIRLYRE